MLIVYLSGARIGKTFCRIPMRDDPFYAWAIIFYQPSRQRVFFQVIF